MWSASKTQTITQQHCSISCMRRTTWNLCRQAVRQDNSTVWKSPLIHFNEGTPLKQSKNGLNFCRNVMRLNAARQCCPIKYHCTETIAKDTSLKLLIRQAKQWIIIIRKILTFSHVKSYFLHLTSSPFSPWGLLPLAYNFSFAGQRWVSLVTQPGERWFLDVLPSR